MKKIKSLEINGIIYNVNLIPSKRRTISLRMISSTGIEVRFPLYLGIDKAYEFIIGKSGWIEKKHSLIRVAEANGIGGGVSDGRILYFNGLPLRVIAGGERIETDRTNIMIPIGFGVDEIENWYKNHSEKAVARFVEANKDLIPPCTIKVKKQKTIWGSCNSKRRIYINSKVSMLPPDVIEYVMWHEICHLAYLNHSKAFYKLLGQKCPGYKEKKAWMKSHSMLLRI